MLQGQAVFASQIEPIYDGEPALGRSNPSGTARRSAYNLEWRKYWLGSFINRGMKGQNRKSFPPSHTGPDTRRQLRVDYRFHGNDRGLNSPELGVRRWEMRKGMDSLFRGNDRLEHGPDHVNRREKQYVPEPVDPPIRRKHS